MTGSTPRGQLAALFPTPAILDELEDSAELNRQLETAILARREGDAGLKLSNRGGWQSRHDFARWSGEAGERLLKHAVGLASAHTTSSGNNGVARWVVDAWANVSGTGSFNMPHVHGATFWSCVYYVSVGEGQGGELILHDPRMPGLKMHAPHYRFKDLGPEVSVDIKPAPGMMVLFPGWVSHHVEPWHGTGTRISVAMNIRAVAPAQQLQSKTPMGPLE
jgi:uncharacterized protein (TIGR02466 family)